MFDLHSTRTNTQFFRRVFPETAPLERLQEARPCRTCPHLSHRLYPPRLFRSPQSRGKSRHLTVSNSSGDKSVLIIICTEAPESTINFLSSGLMVEVDSATQSNFGLKNVASFSKCVPRILHKLLAHCQDAYSCTIFCPQRVVWISVCKRRRWRWDDVSVHPG